MEPNTSQRLLIFDLVTTGHHVNYMAQLVSFYRRHQLSVPVTLVVNRRFAEYYRYFSDPDVDFSPGEIEILPITQAEEQELTAPRRLLGKYVRYFKEWQLFCRYTEQLRASHGLLMFFDTFRYPLLASLRRPACGFSGIYFRPTLHYGSFEGHSSSRKEVLAQQFEKILTARLLRSPKLQSLFSLDPYAVEPLNRLGSSSKVMHLADPISIPQKKDHDSRRLREEMGIAPHRKTFFMFGTINGRKGIYQLLEAVALLSQPLHEKLCIIVAGKVSPSEQEKVAAAIAAARASAPQVQIIEKFEFLSDDDMQKYFEMSDVILAIYQKHVGMSGILLQAAAYQKPVLGSNYGLMGEVINRYRLGLSIDSAVSQEVADGLEKCVLGRPQNFCSPETMGTLVAENSSDLFAKKIFSECCHL
jgi:glycosyltransferase involved in cell wall biosynthesis